MPDPRVSALRVKGRWFRHSHPGSSPLPLREPPPDNRWQRGEIVDALYLADAEATAWAEWYRHLAELMIPPLAQMPREPWTWRVDTDVADLSTPEHLAKLGLAPPPPGRHTWADYQQAGERLAQEGWAGLIAPSAAKPDGKILCLFRTGEEIPGAQPLPNPQRIDQPPPPPTGLRT